MTERGSRVLVAMRVQATAPEAFRVFTEEIGQWWRPNGLFQFTENRDGTLSFEPGPQGRLIERYDDGTVFEIGRVKVWDPPSRLVVGWREASFAADQETELHVRFAGSGEQTRITVEHFGWDHFPREHAARHGAELMAFQQRFGEWWQALLTALDHRLTRATEDDDPRR